MDDLLVSRALAADLTIEGDGRTVIGQCVPWDSPTLVDDGDGPYMESWRRGAFRSALRDPPRVRFNYNHGATAVDQIGRATAFDETDAGLNGVFRVTSSSVGDHVLELVRDGTIGGLSVHARIHRSRTRDGLVERTAATLLHVALTGEPAYPEARVLAMRSGSTTELDMVRAEQDRLRLLFSPER